MLGIDEDFHQRLDLHIHVPEGATPKDGPSAGVGMCTALVSALTGIPVRSDVAMTGEITLRGEVLPIGGLKEKLLAAHRGGIATVLIPKDNEKDLAEIPKNIKDKLRIVPVRWMDEVLQLVAAAHAGAEGDRGRRCEGEAPKKAEMWFERSARALGATRVSGLIMLLTAVFAPWYKVGVFTRLPYSIPLVILDRAPRSPGT